MKIQKKLNEDYKRADEALRIGEMGRTRSGEVILRTYSNFVTLDDPSVTYSSVGKYEYEVKCSTEVRKLQPGESVTLAA